MKNTKSTGKIKRTVASLLAAAMLMTTAASVAASADNTQAVNSMSTTQVLQQKKDINKLEELGIDTLLGALQDFVPGGFTISPMIKMFANSLLGESNELTLDDVNVKLDDLFSKIDKLNDDLRDSMENITALQNFDTFDLKTFNSQIKEILSQIQTIRKLNISDDEKYARIAALINNNSNWAESGNVFVTFSSLTQSLNRASLTKKVDIFTIIYDHFAKSEMFSGAALDKAKPVADLIMTDYFTGYYALIQCLSAQLKVCNMPSENKGKIDQKYLSRVTDDQEIITKKIEEITEAIFGEKALNVKKNANDDSSDGIKKKYDDFVNTDRMTLINKGSCTIKLSRSLTVTGHGVVPTIDPCSDDVMRYEPISRSTSYFNNNITPKMEIDTDNIKAIASFINGKGITLRQFLKNSGFNVDNIPQNANILTGGAYNDIASIKHASVVYGSIMYHTYYKGINIDAVDPTENEITLHNVGCHALGLKSWNFIESGNVVTFNKA